MTRTADSSHHEGLKVARLLMVLSSISPLFILWAIRGNSLIPDVYFVTACSLMVIVPNGFLWLRLRTARSLQDKRELTVGHADDHRDHILVYLFAMLLPFYSEDLGSWRYFGSSLAAMAFIVFLFWHLNLHYMNLLFAALGYRVFTVSAGRQQPAHGQNELRSHHTTRQRLARRTSDRLAGDLGGQFTIRLEGAPFTHQGHAVRINSVMRLLAPLNYRTQTNISVDGGPFTNFGNPWWRKEATAR